MLKPKPAHLGEGRALSSVGRQHTINQFGDHQRQLRCQGLELPAWLLLGRPQGPIGTAGIWRSASIKKIGQGTESKDVGPLVDRLSAEFGAERVHAIVRDEIVEIARRHRLVLMTDEIYDGITYDGAAFVPLAPLAGEVPCISYGGLSKLQRACGYRIGWMSLSGDWKHAQGYVHGLVLLASMRLCSNVPGQWAIAPALTGPDTMSALTGPGGRLHESRRAVVEACARSEFLSLVAPQGALYAFPGVNRDAIPVFDDEAFALALLETEHVLLVAGSSFNVPYRNHFRVTLLPEAPVMREVFERIERALAREAERAAPAARVA